MGRLVMKVPLSSNQAQASAALMDGEGSCTCGRPLTKLSAKLILCIANSKYSSVPEARDSLLMAAYCYDCSSRINGVLKWLKDRALPKANG